MFQKEASRLTQRWSQRRLRLAFVASAFRLAGVTGGVAQLSVVRLHRAMSIASIGSVVRVTPGDELQILRGKSDYEFVEDRSSFRVRVSDIIREDGALIGVSGPVIDGHARYQGLVATLLVRCDDSHWELDIRSGVNFKIGSTVARRVKDFPIGHPDGTAIDSYPHIVRYGSIESEA